MSTYAQEQADRIRIEREAPFNPTHIYDPIGWDRFDPRGVQGEPVHEGPVELLREATRALHQGMPADAKQMFNVVRDPQGNRQHVNRKSLTR
jgi:hypothetical protein